MYTNSDSKAVQLEAQTRIRIWREGNNLQRTQCMSIGYTWYIPYDSVVRTNFRLKLISIQACRASRHYPPRSRQAVLVHTLFRWRIQEGAEIRRVSPRCSKWTPRG